MTAPAPTTSPVRPRPPVNFRERPMLVFWETTRACLLACPALPGQRHHRGATR